jgi:hypothetical protein
MTGNRRRAPAAWLLWVLPSFADLFFLVPLCMLAFSSMSAALLRDADTGCNIRSGGPILLTRTVPRTDPFSYTKQGEPWCALAAAVVLRSRGTLCSPQRTHSSNHYEPCAWAVVDSSHLSEIRLC